MALATQHLLDLLAPDRPTDVRAATLLVLGELGVKESAVAKAVATRLDDADAAVRVQALKAVGKLKVDAALPRLLERVDTGGEEAALAAEAAAKLGAKGVKALQGLMPKVSPGLRRYIAAALAASGSAGAEAARVTVLLDKDPGVVDAAARSIAQQIPTLSAAARRGLTDQLLKLASDRKNPLAPATEAEVVRLLTALDDPRAAEVLWSRTMPPHPAEVRAAALQAVGRWVDSPDKQQLERLFASATDADFRVAATALMILKRLPVSTKAAGEWLALLEAPDVAVRRLALDKIGARDTKEVATALLGQLNHPDRGLRDATLARLTRMEHGRKALTTALLDADTPDHAWSLARAQGPYAKEYPVKWRDELFAQATKHLDANDRRAEALVFLLREAEPQELRERLEKRAEALRKKKDYETALGYLNLITRDPAAAIAIKLERAGCGLKASAKDMAPDARANDPCLQQFINLCQQDDAELVAWLGKAKWLDPEDLYYLGFHLVEQAGRPQRVGGEVLKMVVKRAGKAKVATAAKSKLRSVGIKA